MASIEHKAARVRKRLLRVGLDSIRASQMSREAEARGHRGPAPPPPPPPIAVARFASAHTLTENGRACSVCCGSATIAALSGWLKSECFQLEHVDGVLARVPRGRRLHLAGGWTHPSHALVYHKDFRLWYCGTCGFFGQAQLRGLGKPCKLPVTQARRDYLDRISRGLFPKCGS